MERIQVQFLAPTSNTLEPSVICQSNVKKAEAELAILRVA